MTIRIRMTVDPQSPLDSGTAIVARSEASQVLEHELTQYCKGRIQGRSFLIAGHRGAGKTTMVADVLRRIEQNARNGDLPLRPLQVILHGPSLFSNLGDPPQPESPADVQPDATKPVEDAGTASSASVRVVLTAAAQQATASVERTAADEDHAGNDAAPVSDVEGQAQRALEQVILCLHRAVVVAYMDAFRAWVNDTQARSQASAQDDSDSCLLQPEAQWAELAAQFEIELMEDPRASRLREFYAGVGALQSGVLYGPGSSQTAVGQGANELVALNGICTAHQRISGVISGRDEDKLSKKKEARSEHRVGWQSADFIKPLASVFSGVVVAAGASAGQHALWSSALFGLLTMFGASFAFSSSFSSTKLHERTVDRTFIPDLSVRTLDRVLPTLLRRLVKAGLAPVLVIDELDKIDLQAEDLEKIVSHLKKLMAENVFSCFLTDRGYLELMTMKERSTAYAKTYTNFSHSLFVTHEPADLDKYMNEMFIAEPDEASKIDLDLLKWVLRHRSQMHALALNREIAAIRNDHNEVTATSRELRSSPVYAIDLTLQVAIEHRLNSSEVQRWLRQRPRMRLTLLDALYHISRRWQEAPESELDLTDKGLPAFHADLEKRMNLTEVCGVNGRLSMAEIFKKDDLNMLDTQVRALAKQLCLFAPGFSQPSDLPDPTQGPPSPRQWVISCLLTGDDSVLIRLDKLDDNGKNRYSFRYYPSGERLPPVRIQEEEVPVEEVTLEQQTLKRIEELRAEAAEPAAFLDRLARTLCLIMFDAVGVQSSQSDWEVFYKLADELGVLSPNPPARDVQEAATRLAGAKLWSGSVTALESDLDMLKRFERMIRANLDLIELALCTAARLGALDGAPLRSDAIMRGLRAMSSGLKLAQIGEERVRDVMRSFNQELEERLHLVPHAPAAAATDADSAVERMSTIVDAWYVGRRSDAKTLASAWSSLADAAWKNFGRDSSGALFTEANRPARLELIVCAANARGPGKFFTLNALAPPLEDWTNVAYRALAQPGLLTAGDDRLPPELFPHALRMLGFNLLPREFVAPVLANFAQQSGTAYADLDEMLGPSLNMDAGSLSSVGPNVPATIVIVPRSAARSKTFEWSAPQVSEVMVIMEINALIDALDDQQFAALLKLTSSVELRWDGTPIPDKRERLLTIFGTTVQRADRYV
ncbi:hypothetical protein [Paraburkholderia unamae]|uniref:Uncharacterized protein n=1 Tax=Paraburkholderia unamae TaxID=219649 RepID=A0ACC6RFN1_9BURK